jgi:hypothetical protein
VYNKPEYVLKWKQIADAEVANLNAEARRLLSTVVAQRRALDAIPIAREKTIAACLAWTERNLRRIRKSRRVNTLR